MIRRNLFLNLPHGPQTIAEWQKLDAVQIHPSVMFTVETWHRRFYLAEYLELRNSCLCIFPANYGGNEPKESSNEHSNTGRGGFRPDGGLDVGVDEGEVNLQLTTTKQKAI